MPDREVRLVGQAFGHVGLGAVDVIEPGMAAGHECERPMRANWHMVEHFQGLPIPVQDHVSLAHCAPIPRLVKVRIDLLRVFERHQGFFGLADIDQDASNVSPIPRVAPG